MLNNTLAEKKFNTRINITVDWAELDLFGHVNNVMFFKYIQTARVNYCEGIGLTSLNNNTLLSFMVASSKCQFKKPLHYPGEITVSTRVGWIKNTSMQLEYRIETETDLIAEAEDVIVVFDHQQKIKAQVNADIRQKISTIEGRSF